MTLHRLLAEIGPDEIALQIGYDQLQNARRAHKLAEAQRNATVNHQSLARFGR